MLVIQIVEIWLVAFGRFKMEAMNPQVKGLSPQQLAELGSALGCSFKSAHIAEHQNLR
jgi:hypothetical protein